MLNFQLISASGIKFEDDVYEVIVPTKDGTIAIAQDHMPLISAGAPGVLSIKRQSTDSATDMEHFAVYGGILQVAGKSARFVTDDVTTSDEVVEHEAEAALERAQKLTETATSRQALEEAKHVANAYAARLNLAKLKRRHHR